MVNIAIVGAGNIAKRVIKGISYTKNSCLYAIVSRNSVKAKTYQEQYGATCSYASLPEALADENIDLFYLCTPNQVHYDQIKACLLMGKNVMCEKPMVENAAQIKELFALAKAQHCFLMEAEKTVFTPLNTKLLELVKSGAIGKLRAIRADYATRVAESDLSEDHWVFDRQFGGCAYDIGVYPICFANYFAQSAIAKIGATAAAPKGCTDYFMGADLVYENGVAANISSSWLWHPEDGHKGVAFLGGEKGYIVIYDYWKNNQAVLYANGKREEITVLQESDFTGEISHASECIENGLLESPVMGQQASLEIMKILEAIKAFKSDAPAI